MLSVVVYHIFIIIIFRDRKYSKNILMRLSYFNPSFIYVDEIRHPDQKQLRGGKDLFQITGCSPSLKELRQEFKGSPDCLSIQYDFLSKKKLQNTLLASKLSSQFIVSWLSRTVPNYLPRDGTTYSELGSPPTIIIQTLSHRWQPDLGSF